jgi:hypothetical protein
MKQSRPLFFKITFTVVILYLVTFTYTTAHESNYNTFPKYSDKIIYNIGDEVSWKNNNFKLINKEWSAGNSPIASIWYWANQTLINNTQFLIVISNISLHSTNLTQLQLAAFLYKTAQENGLQPAILLQSGRNSVYLKDYLKSLGPEDNKAIYPYKLKAEWINGDATVENIKRYLKSPKLRIVFWCCDGMEDQIGIALDNAKRSFLWSDLDGINFNYRVFFFSANCQSYEGKFAENLVYNNKVQKLIAPTVDVHSPDIWTMPYTIKNLLNAQYFKEAFIDGFEENERKPWGWNIQPIDIWGHFGFGNGNFYDSNKIKSIRKAKQPLKNISYSNNINEVIKEQGLQTSDFTLTITNNSNKTQLIKGLIFDFHLEFFDDDAPNDDMPPFNFFEKLEIKNKDYQFYYNKYSFTQCLTGTIPLAANQSKTITFEFSYTPGWEDPAGMDVKIINLEAFDTDNLIEMRMWPLPKTTGDEWYDET